MTTLHETPDHTGAKTVEVEQDECRVALWIHYPGTDHPSGYALLSAEQARDVANAMLRAIGDR
jgi:hypothetical protein